MRIYDVDNDRVTKSVVLYLKEQEAQQLISSVGQLFHGTGHTHVNDTLHDHNITVALYDSPHQGQLSEREKLIINEDR